MVAPVTNYSVHMNARPALSGGAFTAGFAVCNPNNAGWVVANTTNLASGAVDIGGIALETAVSGGASVQVLTAGYCPPEVIGTLSGTGDWVQVGSTGALSRGTSVTSATIGKYQSDGGVIVNLSLQSALVVAAVYDSGYVLVSDYGATDAALTAADAVAQGYTPPKRLLATEQITLANNITVASELVFEGGSITAASAKTLTLSHSVRPERRQIVFGSAVLAFSYGHKQVEVYPEMWGADPGGFVCGGATVSGGLTLANGDATVGGSGFTSDLAGKICVVFEQTGLDAFVSTVASVTSSSRLELASNSTVDITTASSPQVWIGTDSYAALRAAIDASRSGEIFVSLASGGEYGTATRLDPRPSGSGGLKLRGNHAWLRWCGTAGAHKVFSTDDGLNTDDFRYQCDIENLTVSGCMLAQDAIYMANETYPGKGRSMSGQWRNVNGYHVQRFGHYHHAAQVAKFDRCESFYTGGNAWTLIACNGTTFSNCRGSVLLGASSDSLTIDSYPAGGGANAYGGGDVTVQNYVCEIVTGSAIVVRDTAGSSGTVVTIDSGHLEGCGEDGIIIDREGTVVTGGISVTGPGGTTYYPFRATSKATGSTIGRLVASSFDTAKLGGIVESGATNLVTHGVSNSTTDAIYDATVTDVWSSKLDIRRSTGDLRMQGKLFVGSSTYTPSTTLDDALMLHGHARLRTGGLQMHTGGVLSPYGGIGKGTNYLLRSEEFDSASWTKSNCTVTANSALGPIAGTLADTLAFTSAAGFIRQEYAYGSSLADLNWTSGIWMRTASGTVTINIAQSVGSAATISSTTWTITDEWQFIRTTGSSSNTGTTFRLQIGPGSGTPTVYAWGACSQLVEDYAELAGGVDYAKTLGTVRTVKSQGPVFNAPPVLPGDSFTAVAGGKVAVAGAVVTITDARCTATCMVDFEPTNAAAVALGNASRAPAAGSFALTFAGAPGGTETFNYRLTEIWKL